MGPKVAWNSALTPILVTSQGAPQHRGRDLFLRVGDPQWVLGKFAYGLADKDLKGEDVYLLRNCTGSSEHLGTATTTRGFPAGIVHTTRVAHRGRCIGAYAVHLAAAQSLPPVCQLPSLTEALGGGTGIRHTWDRIGHVVGARLSITRRRRRVRGPCLRGEHGCCARRTSRLPQAFDDAFACRVVPWDRRNRARSGSRSRAWSGRLPRRRDGWDGRHRGGGIEREFELGRQPERATAKSRPASDAPSRSTSTAKSRPASDAPSRPTSTAQSRPWLDPCSSAALLGGSGTGIFEGGELPHAPTVTTPSGPADATASRGAGPLDPRRAAR